MAHHKAGRRLRQDPASVPGSLAHRAQGLAHVAQQMLDLTRHRKTSGNASRNAAPSRGAHPVPQAESATMTRTTREAAERFNNACAVGVIGLIPALAFLRSGGDIHDPTY